MIDEKEGFLFICLQHMLQLPDLAIPSKSWYRYIAVCRIYLIITKITYYELQIDPVLLTLYCDTIHYNS